METGLESLAQLGRQKREEIEGKRGREAPQTQVRLGDYGLSGPSLCSVKRAFSSFSG